MSERASAPAASERRTRRRRRAGFWEEVRAGFWEEFQADLSRLSALGASRRKTPRLQPCPVPIPTQDTIATVPRPQGQRHC
jgi:hypothetical protein